MKNKYAFAKPSKYTHELVLVKQDIVYNVWRISHEDEVFNTLAGDNKTNLYTFRQVIKFMNLISTGDNIPHIRSRKYK